MVRKYGKAPYQTAVLHGGPGAAGSASGLALLISKRAGVLEPMQSKDSIEGLIEELHEQLEENCSGKVILAGHSWGAWLAGLYAEKYPRNVKKVILIGCAPLEECYVSAIEERRRANMTPEETEEFGRILQYLANGSGEKSGYLRRLGEICGRADGYEEEESLCDETDADGALYEKVWNEASGMRSSGELLERFRRIACPLTLIQGAVDPHPVAGVLQPLKGGHADMKAYVLDRCGHTPWRERYARAEFARIMSEELEGG